MSAGRTGRKPWGTYFLYIVAVGGFLYLFIPLLTIVQFSFNQQKGKRNTEWNSFTFDNWKPLSPAFQLSSPMKAMMCQQPLLGQNC